MISSRDFTCSSVVLLSSCISPACCSLRALDGFTFSTYDGIELASLEGSTKGTTSGNLEVLLIGDWLGFSLWNWAWCRFCYWSWIIWWESDWHKPWSYGWDLSWYIGVEAVFQNIFPLILSPSFKVLVKIIQLLLILFNFSFCVVLYLPWLSFDRKHQNQC